LLSYSRAAFVAILLLLIVMTFMRYIRPSQLMVSAALLVMITLVAAPGYWTRMDTIRGVEGLVSKNASVKPDAITRSRITETLAALYVFFDYPILGVGPAQYSKYYSIEYMGISEIAFRRVTTTRRAHCLYTELAAETGIVGFSLFMAIVFFIMIHLMKARRRWINKNPEFSHMATAILLSIIAYLGTAIFAHLSYQRYYWSLIALGGAAIHIFASEASDDELPDMRS
jgi:O-antigen ligase